MVKGKDKISVNTKRESTPLEDKFMLALEENGPFPRYVRNCRVIPARKYEVDFYFADYRVAVEIQGGIFMPHSGHTGAGQVRDYEKCNLAQLMGVILLQYTSSHLSSASARAEVAKQVRTALRQRGWSDA